jgi:UDP-N-acetylglucosamine:LPS N-acetylglucosamine transferase
LCINADSNRRGTNKTSTAWNVSPATLVPELRRRYFVARFIRDEINHVFSLADLVVSRAGAGTINEICALGKAALYVPLVPTGGDEQTRNARVCENAGAAVVVKQAELNGESLLAAVSTLLADRRACKQWDLQHTRWRNQTQRTLWPKRLWP